MNMPMMSNSTLIISMITYLFVLKESIASVTIVGILPMVSKRPKVVAGPKIIMMVAEVIAASTRLSLSFLSVSS